jgi:hypothetical protein
MCLRKQRYCQGHTINHRCSRRNCHSATVLDFSRFGYIFQGGPVMTYCHDKCLDVIGVV